MNVSPRPARAEISSAADVAWKSLGRSKLTTSSVIAKAKTPSVRASSRPFETNSLVSAIILPDLRWIERKHGQHAAGFSFLGPVGIVTFQIAGRAGAGVMDVLNTERATLPDDFGGEVDFVMRGANAGTELHDHVRG